MNEKITLQDIINLLSAKHDMTKKDAELFVKTMFDLIEEALANEKYVKIGEHVWIGKGATVLYNSCIGKGNIIGAVLKQAVNGLRMQRNWIYT